MNWPKADEGINIKKKSLQICTLELEYKIKEVSILRLAFLLCVEGLSFFLQHRLRCQRLTPDVQGEGEVGAHVQGEGEVGAHVQGEGPEIPREVF